MIQERSDRHRCRAPRIFSQLILCLAMIMSACAAVQQPAKPACGPFGDPPADVIEAPRPLCIGGIRLGPWADSDGSARYACLYQPAHVDQGNRLPMVVYLHPSLFGIETVRLTNLLHYQDSMALGESAKGFIVLAPEGRKTTHYYPFPDQKGVGWDNWYRQFNPVGDVKIGRATYKQNVDAATIDHFINEMAATGSVDTSRIYITGWSNGAAMAYLYALNRPNIAALAVYSAPDPFGAFNDRCPQKPVTGYPKNDGEIRIFNPGIPTMHIYNNCEIAGLCPNCEQLNSQLTAAGVSVEDRIIDALNSRVSQCMKACGTNPDGDPNALSDTLGWTLGIANHSRWPLNWTRTMLDFFRDHALNSGGLKSSRAAPTSPPH
jgi:dienelactone hydrolase